MSLAEYLEYRDSGVAWLGEIPAHWEVRAIKTIGRGEGSLFVDGDWIESKDISDAGVRYITTGNVGLGRYKEQGSGFISADTFSSLNCTEVLPGDVLVSRLNSPIGRACIVPNLGSKIVTSVDNVIVRPSKNFDRRYLVFRLSSPDYFFETGNIASGATMQRISRSDLGDIRLAFPPYAEQVKISDFLDRETAKIDALIVEHERLLALLAEKRQATISHAVTCGLNLNSPMKDSGVPWLGEVPNHWAVRSLKSIVSTPITDGPHETPRFLDEGVPFVSAEAVSSGSVNFERVRGYISPEDDARYSLKYKPQLHDIYMVKSGATTGVTAIVECETDFNIWSPLAAIRCEPKIADPWFVLQYLRSRNFQEGVALNWSFGTQQTS